MHGFVRQRPEWRPKLWLYDRAHQRNQARGHRHNDVRPPPASSGPHSRGPLLHDHRWHVHACSQSCAWCSYVFNTPSAPSVHSLLPSMQRHPRVQHRVLGTRRVSGPGCKQHQHGLHPDKRLHGPPGGTSPCRVPCPRPAHSPCSPTPYRHFCCNAWRRPPEPCAAGGCHLSGAS